MGSVVNVDIGGTFTDCVITTERGEIASGKAPTTRDRLVDGFFGAIQASCQTLGRSIDDVLSDADRMTHASTLAVNAVVTGEGAITGLLTTRGHGDTLRIMDGGGRTTGVHIERVLHFPAAEMPDPLVAPEMTREISERADYAGREVVRLNEREVEAAATELVEQGVEAIAVCYLWSFLAPAHEIRTREVIRAKFPDLEVSLSCEVAPKVGEYPRTAATVLNAYVAPLVQSYTTDIEERARAHGYRHRVLFMQGAGGLATGAQIRSLPIQMLLSGPVAGVIGSQAFAGTAGHGDVITTDMGGTTLDVSVIVGGRPLLREEARVKRHTAFLNVVDVQSIGAGGGSIAWVDDATGTLRVGPRSAGAEPGPACYGRGGKEATVTDADLVLGVLNPDTFAGGIVSVSRERAIDALRPLADRLQLTLDECAAGIVRVVDEHMADLIRSMTIQRGLDPRNFTIYAFGGGGGVHAGLYTSGLDISEYIVPLSKGAAVWSALGLGAADLVRVYEQPMFLEGQFDPEQIARAFDRMESQALEDFDKADGMVARVTLGRFAKCKYGLQVYEVVADVPAGKISAETMTSIVESFERTYAARYGPNAGYREAGVVLTGLGVRAYGHLPRGKPYPRPSRNGCAKSSPVGERDVYWEEHGGRISTPIWEGGALAPGDELSGPAVVDFPTTTLVVRPGCEMRMDEFGSAIVRILDKAVNASGGHSGG